MRYGGDPVRAGFVTSLAHPGGNITGLASINAGLIGKRFELLLEVVPAAKRVAVLTAQSDVARLWRQKNSKKWRPQRGLLEQSFNYYRGATPIPLTTHFWL